jgi:hypothetical protein
MRPFDIQGIAINVPRSTALAFIADPARLPDWAEAFASVSEGQAIMRTPNGEVGVGLDVRVSADAGTVDWTMTFPDGSVATAYSRVVAAGTDRCIYGFILTPPPVPLEQLEGALEAQSRTLTGELERLKEILEHDT